MSTTDEQPNGAHFMKCALQVNPYAYLETNGRVTDFDDEPSFNAAMVQSCLDNQVQLVGLTDHHRVRQSVELWRQLEDAGIVVLPGFEAVCSDGVHMLLLFDGDTPVEQVERRIGELGVSFDDGNSDLGDLNASSLLERAAVWDAVIIPAHVETPKGLLTALGGAARVGPWTSPSLTAVGITKPLDQIESPIRDILQGRQPEYGRSHPPAIVMAKDVYGPDDLAAIGTWSWIKMTTPGLDGVRQAFLDPKSRIALPPGELTTAGPRFTSIGWSGGFLDGLRIDFNEQFNVLIGGRGTGKSTVIESLRYALDLEPWSAVPQQDFLQHVLKPGTQVSVGVCCVSPQMSDFVITRVVGGAPSIVDDEGETVHLSPSELLGHPEVFGQRELAVLADDATGRSRLLERFMPPDPTADARLSEVSQALQRNRKQMSDLQVELDAITSRVERIPAVEAQIKRLQDAGLDERLEAKNLLAKDGRILQRASKDVDEVLSAVSELVAAIPNDRAYLSPQARSDAAVPELLEAAEATLATLAKAIDAAVKSATSAMQTAVDDLTRIQADASTAEKEADEDYQQALRDLQHDGVDASDYVRLGTELDALRKADGGLKRAQTAIAAAADSRRHLLQEREEALASIRKRRKQAAKHMRRQLQGTADVIPLPGRDRSELIALIHGLDGRTDKLIEGIKSCDDLDPLTFVDAIRSGVGAIQTLLPDVTDNQATRLAGSDEATLMRMEEVVFEDQVQVLLNLAGPGETTPQWASVEHLSTGQKATAMLFLVLLDGDDPLVIDQPEDDLDNQFISESLVPLIRDAKTKRQLILSTHNANIPVLGDAELVVVMGAEGGAEAGHGYVLADGRGSIDDQDVRHHIERLLEGGKDAFERRRRRYGYQ